jgi:hypothetical protein
LPDLRSTGVSYCFLVISFPPLQASP